MRNVFWVVVVLAVAGAAAWYFSGDVSNLGPDIAELESPLEASSIVGVVEGIDGEARVLALAVDVPPDLIGSYPAARQITVTDDTVIFRTDARGVDEPVGFSAIDVGRQVYVEGEGAVGELESFSATLIRFVGGEQPVLAPTNPVFSESEAPEVPANPVDVVTPPPAVPAD